MSSLNCSEHSGRPRAYSSVCAMGTAITCLLMSIILCGCASGLMALPGAGSLADRFSGAGKSDKKKEEAEKKSSRRKKEEDNDFGNKIETPLLADYMSVQGNSLVVLRGVGLVTGLNGTGGDPSPSGLRTQLQNEMARRGVKDGKRILASPNTALVVVTAYLPAMVRKDQRFDVRVALPPNSNARSLKGGWLLETRLFEEQNFEGKTALKAMEYAVAGGAILTGIGVRENSDERQAELMNGTIPGGAVSRVDRDLSIVLKNDKKGTKTSQRVATAVSERFHRYNKYGQRIPCAEAKNDVLVKLQTHEQYVNNFPRYQAVIRNIALNESDVARRMRMEMLARDVLEKDKCQVAALQLEAIGDDSIPFLKDALESDDFEVRFQAAQSLAYLGNPSGVSVLHEAAKNQPAFRIYALVALSVIRDDADAVVALRDLMNSPSLETRYGAFRALRELDPRDPALNPVSFRDRFVMHVIDSSGTPMVHVTRRRSPEIVVFGVNQPLHLPLMLNAGRTIRVLAESGDTDVEISSYQMNAEPVRARVPNRLIDIIRKCGELGATYPDMVQLLIEAENQHNFVGEFGIDRLPQAGRLYVADEDSEEATAEQDADGRRIGNAKMIPALFDELDEDELKENESAEKLMSIDFKEVNEGDARRDAKKPREVDSEDSENSSSETDAENAESSGASTDQPDENAASATAETDQPKSDDLNEPGTEPRSAAGSDNTDSADDESSESESTDSAKPKTERRMFGTGFLDRMRRPFGGLSEPEPEP